jgi:hypothetical protein
MPKAYSGDLRVRVIAMVQAGASRREAAEVFSLADSTAVKWLRRWVTYQSLCQEGKGVLPCSCPKLHNGAPQCHSKLQRLRVYQWHSRW